MSEFRALDWAGDARRLEHPWERVIEIERFVGTMMSRRTMKPTVAKLGEAAVEESLRAMATEHATPDGTVTIPYVTELFLARKR